MATITHAKTVTIPDPTQAELDAQIALGNYPPGTTLAKIALASDWNDEHVISGLDDDYIRRDGTTPLTASWLATTGAEEIQLRSSANAIWSSAANVLNIKSGSRTEFTGQVRFAADGAGWDAYFGDPNAGFWDGGICAWFTDSGNPNDRMHWASDDKSLEFQGLASVVLGTTNFKMYYDSGADQAVFSGKGLSGADTTEARWENGLLLNGGFGLGNTNPGKWMNVTSTTFPIVINTARTHTTRPSLSYIMQVSETLSYTGAINTSGIGLFSLTLVDARTLSSGFGVDNISLGVLNLNRNSSFSSNRVNQEINNLSMSNSDAGTYNNTTTTQQKTNRILNLNLTHGFTYAGSSQTMNYLFEGVTLNTTGSPTLTSGTLITSGTFFAVKGIGYLTGTSTAYAYYNDMYNFDNSWCLYNTSVSNNLLGNDNSRSYLGTGADFYLVFDGTHQLFEMPVIAANAAIKFNSLLGNVDFIVGGDTDANLLFADAGNDRVGIGMNNPGYKFDVTGDINCSGVYRSGGTAGVSGTITAVSTVTVTNGIITNIA